MRSYYLKINDKTTKVKPEEFQTHVADLLLEAGFKPDPVSLKTIIVCACDRQGDDLDGDILKQYEIALDAVKDSERLAKGLGDFKDSEILQKNKKAAQRQEKAVNDEHAGLLKAEELGLAIQSESTAMITSRVQDVVGENFDILPSGGLVLKKGVQLSKEDAFAGVAGLLGLAQAGEQMQGISTLALGDIIVIAENKFGEDFNISQLRTTGKGQATLEQARAIAQQFSAKERAEIDPDGNHGFSHWQEIVMTKGLTKKTKTKVAKLGAKRKSSTRKMRDLSRTVARLDPEDRDTLLDRADSEISTTDGAIELAKEVLSSQGKDTGDKTSYLYIMLDPARGVVATASNGVDERILKKNHAVIHLGARATISTDGYAWEPIKFVRAKPDTLEEDEIQPSVESLDTLRTNMQDYGSEQPYGDYRIFEEGGTFVCEGTVEGRAADGYTLGGSSISEAVQKLKEELLLDDDFQDEEGNYYNIRTDLVVA